MVCKGCCIQTRERTDLNTAENTVQIEPNLRQIQLLELPPHRAFTIVCSLWFVPWRPDDFLYRLPDSQIAIGLARHRSTPGFIIWELFLVAGKLLFGRVINIVNLYLSKQNNGQSWLSVKLMALCDFFDWLASTELIKFVRRSIGIAKISIGLWLAQIKAGIATSSAKTMQLESR